MSYLGSNEAAFRLGNQEVSVYLGAVEVYSPGITLYFNGAVDADWAELGNWWQDSGHTVAATALPTAADSVIAAVGISINSGSEPTVVNFTLNSNGEDQSTLDISITVTGEAVFNADAFLSSQITGNATFNNSSVNVGNVTGTATFNDSACNAGGTAGTFVPNPPPACPE